MRVLRNGLLIVAVLLVPLSACFTPLDAALPATLQDINPIVQDTGLTPQQKRAQLAELGLSPLVINSLLVDVRIANQFGGDLRTAYDKVVGGHLDQLTPDEIQIYADEASDVDDGFNYTLDDTAAAEIQQLFETQDISTSDELDAFLAVPANELLVPVEIPDGVLDDVFVGFDPTQLLDNLP